MQFSPVGKCEIDNHQRGCGHFFTQALTGLDIAGRYKHQCNGMQAGIMTQHKEAIGGGGGAPDDAKDVMRCRVVEALHRRGSRRVPPE